MPRTRSTMATIANTAFDRALGAALVGSMRPATPFGCENAISEFDPNRGPYLGSPCWTPVLEAFIREGSFDRPMARFPEAEKRLLLKMICMNCYARNAPRATRCRKCHSTELRPKAKEARKE